MPIEEARSACFYRLMQALSDEQRIESLEKKIDKGFSEMSAQIVSSERALRGEIQSVRGEIQSVRGEIQSVRTEVQSVRGDSRSDFRTLIAIWVATVLAFVGLLAAHL